MHWDFKITVREAAGLCRLLALEKWWKGMLGFGAAGALASWMYTLGRCEAWVQAGAALLAAAGVMLGFFAGLMVWTGAAVRRQARKTGRTEYVQETEIDGFGVRVCVGKDRAKLGFDRLARVVETRSAFYLFLSATQAWILPKAQMDNCAQTCRELRELFRKVIERGRLRLK